jgi:S1-C subfamily serine protease
VNLLDLVLVVVAVSAAVGGYRLGLLARALSWAGMLLGLLVAARVVPTVVERFEDATPTARLLLAVGTLLGGAFLGQAVGLVVGARARLALPMSGRPLDRAGGAAAGVVGLLVAVWLLAPAMADVPGGAARLARGSVIVREVDDRTPSPPDALQTLRRLVGEHQFPQVFSALRPAPDVGPPPAEAGIASEVAAGVARSTVKVEGEACGRIQEGSGFVAEPGVVVTNAHVVAGQERTSVVRPDGSRTEAQVVHFDPERDLAVLSVPEVGAPPLPIGTSAVGGTGAVFGFPGGGPLEASPFEIRESIDAVGRDLYDGRDTRRQVLVLASELAPGDSGAPLVDPSGAVVGVAFAVAPDQRSTAYALSVAELEATLAAAGTSAASTGPCLT